ncbi:ATP-binding protein [Streptomyces sp. PSKA30]|uniref:ATP-binding protein n=1 Tax=Streptomyces sp. PSKA30 TaxID=2874597 RepID=UPI001CD0FA22|nr:ATP-binding protein [Streptomyces sp. PSKA30]MBZ9644807.1 ATP-binding protein [Streptomyces sp. PSKA30]
MTAGPAPRWSRPASGREPAAAALLSWLGDPRAPGLAVVTGAEGSGKSRLLAWLIGHGTRPGTVSERRIHGFVPLPGQTATTAAWMLGEQLSIAARSPGDLLAALAADRRRTVIALPELHSAEQPGSLVDLVLGLASLEHVRVLVEVRSGTEWAQALTAGPCARMDLDEPQWTDEARRASWDAAHPAGPAGQDPEPEEPFDLDDPASVCAADPWSVTTAYERSEESHGGLRAAWLRAGASLTREQPAAERALVLLAALGDAGDPRLPATLTSLARDASWTVVWHRVRGDVTPPWPGPVRSLAAGTGPLAGQLVVADHQGTVRVLDAESARSVGRLPHSVPGLRATAEHGDGTVSVLDEHGLLHTQRAAESAKPKGLAALLDDGLSGQEQLVKAVQEYTQRQQETVTALTGAGDRVVLGDAAGTVHVVTVGAEPRTAALHRGRVTAVAGTALPVSAEGDTVLLLYTGGADGTVRAWAPHTDPMPEPVAARNCAVNAVAVAMADAGLVLAIAWADGLVEHRALDDDRLRTFHPGSQAHALAFTAEGDLVVGTDEALVRLRGR